MGMLQYQNLALVLLPASYQDEGSAVDFPESIALKLLAAAKGEKE